MASHTQHHTEVEILRKRTVNSEGSLGLKWEPHEVAVMRLRSCNFRHSARLLILPLLLILVGCGTIHISGAINPSTMSVSTGTVSFIHFTAIFDSNGTLINVTIVTLVAPPATTFTFCGNQSSQFAMNTGVQVSFTPGQSCSNLVSVVPH